MAHVKTLAADIGVRPPGSDAERRAARYIEGVLTTAGYTTTVETFTFRDRFDESTVRLPDDARVAAFLIEGSALGRASAVLVDGGVGRPDQIAAAGVRDRIVLLRRGEIPFGEKVANAQQAGALAIIVVNHETGPFRGTLGRPDAVIAALAMDGNQWERLRGALGQPVTIEGAGGMRTMTSQNVFGRRGDTCRAYIGAHYDSVPAGPGANDNATGTAAMLELARVRATDGLCAVAFGAEESGLHGSQAFVTSRAARGAKFMLNLDMLGHIDDAIIIGDAALTRSILSTIGRGADQPLRAGTFPPFASSDHVSFTSVGVPAVTITSGDDPAYHSPRDTYEAVRQADVQTMLRLVDAALAGLLKTLGSR